MKKANFTHREDLLARIIRTAGIEVTDQDFKLFEALGDDLRYEEKGVLTSRDTRKSEHIISSTEKLYQT
jgi:hypothetical protein